MKDMKHFYNIILLLQTFLWISSLHLVGNSQTKCIKEFSLTETVKIILFTGVAQKKWVLEADLGTETEFSGF